MRVEYASLLCFSTIHLRPERNIKDGTLRVRKATSSLMWKTFALHSFTEFCAGYVTCFQLVSMSQRNEYSIII